MDSSRFSDKKTGRLVPINTPMGPDVAFVPDPLKPVWEIPPQLVDKLVAASRALSKLDGIGRTLPHPELLVTPLHHREAITSSRIEGTYATAEELFLFEMNPTEPKSKHDQANAWREVSNYTSALKRGTQLLVDLPFCGRLIKEAHSVLMDGVRGQHSRRGEWRDYQVAIGSDRRYVPPPVPEMKECLNNLEKFMNEPNKIDPLVLAYIVHYQFEAIHPFSDGNGRIGRVMLSLMIGRWCDLKFPWLYMSPFFEKYKDEYTGNLFRVSSEGDWTKWIDFCLLGTIQQASDAISRCESLRQLKDEMLNKVSCDKGNTPRTERIIRELFNVPFVRVSVLHKQLNVTYPTAQSDVDFLVKHKILKRVEEMTPKTYCCPDILSVAYGDISE